jgi:hypothetical protein
MMLKKFIEQYDKPDSVILLEGKRTVLENDKDKTSVGSNNFQ